MEVIELPRPSSGEEGVGTPLSPKGPKGPIKPQPYLQALLPWLLSHLKALHAAGWLGWLARPRVIEVPLKARTRNPRNPLGVRARNH